MPADLNLYSSDGSTLVTTFSLTGGNPGVVSDTKTYRVVNDGADVATSPAAIVRAEDEQGDYVLSGARPVDERWVEGKLTGTAATGVEVEATGWQPIGYGRWLTLPQLSQDEWVEIQLRENRPGSASVGEQNYELDIDPGQVSISLDLGRSESYRDGVLTKIGRGWQWIVGGDITEQDGGSSAGPDDTVIMPDLFWIDDDGVPRVKLTHDVTLNQNDGDSAALSSGEGYWAVVSLGASADPIITKGSKAATPLDPDDAPAPSSGTQIGRIQVLFGASGSVIQDSDITMTEEVGAFALTTSAASQQITIGPGEAIVDNRLVRRTGVSQVTLTSSATNHLWLLPDGTWDTTTDASKPDAGAYLRAVLVTDGSGVTSVSDRREWIGGEWVLLTLRIAGELTGSEVAYATWPYLRTGYVWPLGVSGSLSTFGAGNVSGELAADIEATDGAGGAFTTLYTSQVTDDRRLVLDASTSEPVARSLDSKLPEVLALAPLSRVRIETEIVTAFDDGTSAADSNPEDLEIVIPVCLV